MAYAAFDLIGRVVPGGAWLVDIRWGLAATSVVGVAALFLARRIAPCLRSKLWWIPVLGVLPCGFVLVVVFPLGAHMFVGTPSYGCLWRGMDVEVCNGRDWSVLQGRLEHMTWEGKMDVGHCRAFVNAVPKNAKDPYENGWIRCPDDNPRVWTPSACRQAALATMDRCFVCGGVSATNDTYVHAVGFSAACDRAKVRYGVNIPLQRIDDCAETLRLGECHVLVGQSE